MHSGVQHILCCFSSSCVPYFAYISLDCPSLIDLSVFSNVYFIYVLVDGDWTLWGTWGSCSVSCGGGYQSRNRTCTNPEPQYGGANCTGHSVEDLACNPQACASTLSE